MLELQIKRQALQIGFSLVGVAPAVQADGFDRLREWLDRGYSGAMAYLEKNSEPRRHPSSIFSPVRSVVMVGLTYSGEATRLSPQPVEESPVRGKTARYARGPDYHELIWRKLDQLLDWLRQAAPGCEGRGVVDTAPLLERDFARRAGLGWFGKNTMLINKRAGSFVFLGALLVDIELKPDPPYEGSHCGTCTACLEACPTQALVSPGWLDARRCISYLTIELRTPIAEELRAPIGDWMFGCDICQEVCPWNSKPRTSEFPTEGDLAAFDPAEVLTLTETEFRQRFHGTAITRARRGGLLRNAAIVLGNWGDAAALPALRGALADGDEMVREAAQWAIGQIVRRTGADLHL